MYFLILILLPVTRLFPDALMLQVLKYKFNVYLVLEGVMAI